MKDILQLYPKAAELATLIEDTVICRKEEEGPSARFNMAVSGGGSPKALFEIWREIYSASPLWHFVDLYWVDERCVPPEHKESNYGEAKKALLDFIPTDESHIHRIAGESDPATEAARYSSLVRKNIPLINGFPSFDIIIAGIGTDGHTASIFPGQYALLDHPEPYSISLNPYNGQKRISMTGRVMLNAQMLIFYLLGEEKREIVEKIYNSDILNETPAQYIIRKTPSAKFYWDY